MSRKARRLKERFEEKIETDRVSGCWMWIGFTRNGYGCIINKGKKQSAHRLSYSYYKGPVPSKKVICHHCDTPRCVNPEHLFLGTAKDNVKDRQIKGRSGGAYKGEKHRNAKLTDKQAEKIRTSAAPQNDLAEHFKVGQDHISRIQNYKVRSEKMNMDRLANMLQRHEGEVKDENGRHKLYKDSVGKWTIGYGRNLSDRGISDEEADILFENDVMDHANDLFNKFPVVEDLSDARQEALIDMTVNLGVEGIAAFHKMWRAIEREEFDKAADEMENSKWCSQVGSRCTELSEIMRRDDY